jgi:hypothetical protein
MRQSHTAVFARCVGDKKKHSKVYL